MRFRQASKERGSVSLELIFAIGFLLIPATGLLAQLPTWVGTNQAAQTAATEAARLIVVADDIDTGIATATQTATDIINHGLDPEALLNVTVTANPPGELQRGQIVTVTVTVRGSPIQVPGLGSVGNPFNAVGSATERVDDYRGFTP